MKEIPKCPECSAADWMESESACDEDGYCVHSSFTCRECYHVVDYVWDDKFYDKILRYTKNKNEQS